MAKDTNAKAVSSGGRSHSLLAILKWASHWPSSGPLSKNSFSIFPDAGGAFHFEEDPSSKSTSKIDGTDVGDPQM
jgi:hypothetical protein